MIGILISQPLQGGAITRDWWRRTATITFTFSDGVCILEQTLNIMFSVANTKYYVQCSLGNKASWRDYVLVAD